MSGTPKARLPECLYMPIEMCIKLAFLSDVVWLRNQCRIVGALTGNCAGIVYSHNGFASDIFTSTMTT